MTRRHRGDQVAPGKAGEDLTERTVSAPEVVAELERFGAAAVLVRPDRYVLGAANDAAGLSELVAAI